MHCNLPCMYADTYSCMNKSQEMCLILNKLIWFWLFTVESGFYRKHKCWLYRDQNLELHINRITQGAFGKAMHTSRPIMM